MEEIQKESSVNHKLVTVQELEEKATVLRKLGETLTELKSESRWHILHSVHRHTTENSLLLWQTVYNALITHQGTDYLLVTHSQSVKHLIRLRLLIVVMNSLTIHCSSNMFCLITTKGFQRQRQVGLICLGEHGYASWFTPLLSPADQFPGLQSKMRVVLRVEVEAVKFLKEEPHRLDALLKRCKTITDTLATMRKYEPALPESYSTFMVYMPICVEIKLNVNTIMSSHRLGNGKVFK